VTEPRPGQRILIVEDDRSIATGLALNLRIEGYVVDAVEDGETALQTILTGPPDLLLLDISLPRLNGLDVLSRMRQAGHLTPVIVLSARQDEYDKVAALRLGADDYVTKPFALAELLARVVAVLRRSGQSAQRPPVPVPMQAPALVATPAPSPHLRFGEVQLDLATRTVERRGKVVALTHLEFELLSYLCQNGARVLSRDQLLRQVWGTSGSPRTVDNFVAQLRAKLEDDPDHPRHLVTVRGSGYRFDP
jgi:DNA-binding response OmpR family regulator